MGEAGVNIYIHKLRYRQAQSDVSFWQQQHQQSIFMLWLNNKRRLSQTVCGYSDTNSLNGGVYLTTERVSWAVRRNCIEWKSGSN